MTADNQDFENKPAKGISYFTPAQDPPAGTAANPQSTGLEPPKLFQPLKIRGLTIQNRIVLSPLCQYSAQDGHLTDWHLTHLGGIAQRGPGLMTIEATSVVPEGRITPQDSGLWKDSQIAPLERIIEFVHSQGQKIGIQLGHAGRKASTVAPWLSAGNAATERVGGWPDAVKAPSSIPFADTYAIPTEMTKKDIEDLKLAWVAATKRAVKAGVDFVEIHNGHGYLLTSFMSPVSNKRTDEYGGSFENRVRLSLEIAALVRENVPKDIPIFLRISATEWLEESMPEEHSWKLEDTIEFAKLLVDSGNVDVIDISTGGNHPAQKIKGGPAYQSPFALAVKKAVGNKLLVSTVGAIDSGKLANQLLEDGLDLVRIGRGFQKNPGLVWTFAEELDVQISMANQIRWDLTLFNKYALLETTVKWTHLVIVQSKAATERLKASRCDLRCTRDLPQCARCTRQSLTCHYPPPPDRRLLALKRSTTRAAKRQRQSPSEEMIQMLTVDNILQASNTTVSSCHNRQEFTPAKITGVAESQLNKLPSVSLSNDQFDISPKSQSVESLPPRGLGLYLLDLFFSRYSSCSLAFHERRFFEAYLADSLPDHVLKAVFALSSIFMQNHGHSSGPATYFAAISQKTSNRWASAAGSHVLGKVDCPSLESVQTLLVLAMYWFAVGELDRSKIHARLAYTSARLLGFHSRLSEPVINDPNVAVENEIKRRTFWSGWIINGIIPHDDTLTRSHITDAVGIPLPSAELSFYRGRIAGSQKMDKLSSCVPIPSDGDQNEPSIGAEIVKSLSIYFEIQRSIVNFPQMSMLQNLQQVSELYQRSKTLSLAVPQELLFQRSFKGTKLSNIGRLFVLHATYHLNAISLHRPLVPLFSGKPLDNTLHTEFAHACAQIMIQHADAFADMGKAYLVHTNCDSSYMLPFSGYLDLILLKDISVFWAPLRRLWENLTPLVSSMVSQTEVDDYRRNLCEVHRMNSESTSATGASSIDINESLTPCPSSEQLSRTQYIIADGSEKITKEMSSLSPSQLIQSSFQANGVEPTSSTEFNNANGVNSPAHFSKDTTPFTFDDDLFLSTLLEPDSNMLAFESVW
ncbi:hypothetical protein B7463_g12607, partial [Scytalidium lignicola]